MWLSATRCEPKGMTRRMGFPYVFPFSRLCFSQKLEPAAGFSNQALRKSNVCKPTQAAWILTKTWIEHQSACNRNHSQYFPRPNLPWVCNSPSSSLCPASSPVAQQQDGDRVRDPSVPSQDTRNSQALVRGCGVLRESYRGRNVELFCRKRNSPKEYFAWNCEAAQYIGI